MAADMSNIMASLKPIRDFFKKKKKTFLIGVMVLAASYISAVTVSSLAMGVLVEMGFSEAGRQKPGAGLKPNLALTNPVNYHDLRKAIEDRNIFNSEGVFPDEDEVEVDVSATETEEQKEFDLSAPCVKTGLKLSLLGTIFMGSNNSIATVKEQGYSESDIYKEGDAIIGQDGASIAKIERKRVIINNGGIKECLELEEKKGPSANEGFSEPDPVELDVDDGNAGDQPPPDQVNTKECSLEEKFVQEQLGPGFGNIITKARLVPNTQENQVNGFKIFAIDSKSLFAKAGLKNGDVITQVNDVSLKQPEQGFALYQAFQDETEVRINVLRNGKTPVMITCRIK